MQSLLDTLLLISVTICTTIAALIAGCGKKKTPSMMTDLPNGGGSTSVPPPAAAAAGAAPAAPPTPAKGDKKTTTPDEKTPSVAKPVAPGTNPVEQSDKVSKKVPVAGAAEDDGGYENFKDMNNEELKKAL